MCKRDSLNSNTADVSNIHIARRERNGDISFILMKGKDYNISNICKLLNLNMRNSHLEIKTALQIQKPVTEVFEALVDHEKMKNYFISESSGRMEEGKELIWKFPEFDAEVTLKVGSVEQDKYISFYWDADIGLLVEVNLHPGANSSTIVVVTEESIPHD